MNEYVVVTIKLILLNVKKKCYLVIMITFKINIELIKRMIIRSNFCHLL